MLSCLGIARRDVDWALLPLSSVQTVSHTEVAADQSDLSSFSVEVGSSQKTLQVGSTNTLPYVI